MRVAFLMSMLLVTAMSLACDSRTGDAGRQQIRRIDNSFVSVGEIEEYVAAVMDSAGVMGLQMAIVNDGNVVYEDGKISTIAEEELLGSIQRVSEEVSARASAEVRKRRTFQHRLTLEDKY